MKVHRIGNSLMVAIPHETAKRLDIHEGDDVEVVEREGVVLIEPAGHQPELTFIGTIDAGGRLRDMEYRPDPGR